MTRWPEAQYKAYQDRTSAVEYHQDANGRLVAKCTDKKPVKRSRMNKLEARYAQHLDLLQKAGEIVEWRFEPIKLRLAGRTFYTPDFFVEVVSVPNQTTTNLIPPNSLQLHEVKGFWRDDARVKIKVAAELFPWFRFRAVKWVNGQWEYEEF